MDRKNAKRFGVFSSTLGLVIELIYLLVLIIYFTREGFAFPPGPFVQLAAGIITFIIAPILVVLFTAIRFANDGHNKIFGALGMNFIICFAATVCINRYVQLSIIQQSLPNVPSDLSRFLPYSTGSVMLAIENLGWGLFSSLAAISVAPLFSTTRLNKAIRWLFIVYAIISFMSLIGFAVNSPIPIGPIAWGPILMTIFMLLVVYFRNLE